MALQHEGRLTQMLEHLAKPASPKLEALAFYILAPLVIVPSLAVGLASGNLRLTISGLVGIAIGAALFYRWRRGEHAPNAPSQTE